MRRAVCPGSFDPPTVGHLDIVSRAAALFDEVVVAVGVNPGKEPMFSADERVAMLREATADLPGVSVEPFDGLLVAFCADHGAGFVVKGIRSSGDVDHEAAMARMNAALTAGDGPDKAVETVLLVGAADHAYVSSTLVKQIAGLGGDVTRFVPASVRSRLPR